MNNTASHFKFWSAIFRIITESKFLIMKSSLELFSRNGVFWMFRFDFSFRKTQYTIAVKTTNTCLQLPDWIWII